MANKVADDDIYFSCRAKDCGMTWTTNHNKAAVRGWLVSQSQHNVGDISWQLSVATQWLLPTRGVDTGWPVGSASPYFVKGAMHQSGPSNN